MERLTRRTDFRAAAAALRASGHAFVVQARSRAEGGPVRIGFTVSRQVGNAVERNRVRRRLREIVRLSAQDWLKKGQAGMHDGHDYVLIGRRAALSAPFGDLRQELDAALRRIHDAKQGERETRQKTARGTAQETAQGAGGTRQRSLHQAGSPRSPRPPRRQPHDA
jgi:ribonuclease P protein component